MAPQDFYADKSSFSSNMVTENSLQSSGLKFGAIIFNEKHITNMEKFTTAGLSSSIIFGSVTFKKVQNMKPRKYIFIGSIEVDIT
jgi:hypothetical protein